MTIQAACDQFLQDAHARDLRELTIYKYRLLFRQLQQFASEQGLRFIREFDVETLRRFRNTWGVRNLTALKKLEYLRAFLRFAQENEWIQANPARKIKNPKVTHRPTMPFTREEMIRILAACERYPDGQGRTGQANAERLRALVLLLRYSGLRIQDAATLSRDHVADGKLFLYTAKTGTPVYCPLPDFVVNAL
ncbi:MAG: phage integrase SAM-like domain-containing protein, partial [Acidobacteriota bacterium]